jgi:hypothetical protein
MLFSNQEPMGIALLGMSSKDIPMMELFLQKHWSSNCIVVPEHQAKLCILDLDGIEGKKILQQQRDQHTERPLIVLSVHDKAIDGVRVLQKPLRVELLKEAIDIYRSEMLLNAVSVDSEPINEPKKNKPEVEGYVRKRLRSPAVDQNTDKNERRMMLPSASAQARIIHSACTVTNSASEYERSDYDNGMFYENARNLQVILKKTIGQCRQDGQPRSLHFQDGKYVTLLPKSNLSLTNLNDTKLRPRCLLSLQPDQITIKRDHSDERRLLRRLDTWSYSIDALLWKVTLWSSRGRLPLGTSADVAVGLEQWPNLTRVLAIPEFIRIAALWAKQPITLPRTVEALNIEHSYVNAFFCACHALDLIKLYDRSTEQVELQNKVSQNDSNPGLLRRILRRLRAL